MEVILFCGFFGLVGVTAAMVRGWSPVVGFIAGAVLGPLALLLFFVSGVVRASRTSPTHEGLRPMCRAGAARGEGVPVLRAQV